MRFLLIVSLVAALSNLSAEENRQHPELSTLVRSWAQKLGGELWHFGDFVTRRTKAINSFKDTTIIREDGESLLRDIHEKISSMMKEKVEAVKRIMEMAEEAAKDQDEDKIDKSFQFFNAKTLKNASGDDSEDEEDDDKGNGSPKDQEVRYDDSFISPSNEFAGEDRAEDLPKASEYQQDQGQGESEAAEESTAEEGNVVQESVPAEGEGENETGGEIEVTDGSEDPQVSHVRKDDKTSLPLVRNRHFYNIPVNTTYSAVHVPSNVYERSTEVIAGIIWSEELDKMFRHNYEKDRTLSWQYFGSSTGFMRQFPAMIWSQEPVDLFDCRTRSWFIEAASSPKDMVILVDRSGSMTGMRREIARHVVHNILDTLGNNDYVNIYTFSNTTDVLVECFDKILVQANLANVRVLKESMGDFKTEQIANFSLAFSTAFELLKVYRENKKGAGCNQAIMLITDGVQYNYKEVFQKYNWENLPFMNVRVFTYLIGREVSDVREVKWMACANQGYYVHLSTYAEVREEVLQYIPVMARPMVLNPTVKPLPTWSTVYADVTDPKLTNWLWVNRERNKQRERFMAYRRNRTLLPPDEQDKRFVHQQKFQQDNYGSLQVYHMMTSVSLPVYDKKPRKERVANLLGVAGTDVPIEYIQRLMLPYRLGVNGYAFIVTNNGYILTHPDLRPVYQGILKPAYNRVDIMEVEILDDDAEPREFGEEIQELRKRIVMQKTSRDGRNVTLRVKTHLDDMRRITITSRHYFYMGIETTPFTLVVALPHRYGFNRIQHPVENDIHRIRSNERSKGWLSQFFTGNWTIHPDWQYCRYLKDDLNFKSPEEEFLYFLEKMEGTGWKWTQECDRKLICKVVADAKITTWFNENITQTSSEENGPELIKRFGITVTFISTHSGLTRWQDFPQNLDPLSNELPHFHILHNKAIDEIWYKRAVEHHFYNPRNFVYSVPFDAGEDNTTLVTVSHAIIKEDNGKKAPAAVIGYQFYHHILYEFFRNTTTSCGGIKCKRTCESNELHCLMLDDNGYIVVSDNLAETGYFFGKIRPDIMNMLIDKGIYRVTRMYDYQGLCPEVQETANLASRLLTPLYRIVLTAKWFLTVLQSLLALVNEALCSTSERELKLFHEVIERYAKTSPCDHEIYLYSLNFTLAKSTDNVSLYGNNSYSQVYVSLVADSNLLFLLSDDELLLNANRSVFEEPFLRQSDRTTLNYGATLECYVAHRGPYERQAPNLCFREDPFNLPANLLAACQYILSTLSGLVAAEELQTIAFPHDGVLDYHDEDEEGDEQEEEEQMPASASNEKEFDQRLLLKKTKPEPCDNEMWIYSLVHYTDRNITNSAYNKTMADCGRPFIVQKVSGSNLILLVINDLCREDQEQGILSPEPVMVDYNMSLPCWRVLNNDYPRRHHLSCINRNANESEIKLCGKGTKPMSTSTVWLSLLTFSIVVGRLVLD